MYRIDENTYIDDSLVTCAEYQLFIDEMREQKKFFQPDHWRSYQFPAGQAHVPILGVRPSDAQAFCKWLSGREEGEWRFRLPTANEAAQYPIQKQNECLTGFWTLDGMNTHSFAWIGPAPVDAHGIDFSHILALDHALDHTLAANAHILPFDLNHIFAYARIMAADIDLGDGVFSPIALLSLYISRIYGGTGHGQDFDREQGFNIANALYDDLVDSRDLVRNLPRDLALTRDLAINCTHNIKRTFDIQRTRAHTRTRVLHMVLLIWINLIILQERIAGRSPAFEGIRLVKERNPE
jgi:hypothetical protein